MTDTANPFQPMMDAWMKAQTDYFAGFSQNAAPSGSDPFAALRDQAASFMKNAGTDYSKDPMFKNMFDPQAMFAMPWMKDAGNLADMLKMPGLGDLAEIERNRLHVTKEWENYQKSCAQIQEITAKSWREAFEAFQTGFDAKDAWSKGPAAMGEAWLNLLNGKLTDVMAAPDFLEAQAAVIRSGAAYKAKEREIVEEWCKAHSMPTRSEVDGLHGTIAELRREIAALKAAG